MNNIIISPQGKEIKAIENLGDLNQAVVESINMYRAGIIDANALKAICTGALTVIHGYRLQMMYNQENIKKSITFLENTNTEGEGVNEK